MVSNFVDNVITATRLVNKTVFANMDAFKTSMSKQKTILKTFREWQSMARTFEQTSNNSNDNKTGDPEQIPKEDVPGRNRKYYK